MALKNCTEDENRLKPFRELFCSAEYIRDVDGEFIFLSTLSIFLSIIAFLRNTLILVALHKETSLHPPSKPLYRNLAITDLCAGIIEDPLAVTYLTSSCKGKMGYLLSRKLGGKFLKLYFVHSVFTNIDCNKRGQTSRLVAGAQIQTSCNFEKNIHNCNSFLDFFCCRCICMVLESPNKFHVSIFTWSSVSSHHNRCLHKNFLLSAS